MKKYLRIAIMTATLVLMGVMFANAASYPAPTHLKQTADSNSSFTVEWDALTGVDGTARYAVQWSTSNNFDDKGKAEIFYSPKAFISGLNAGKTYYIRVAGCNTDYDENGERVYDPGAWSKVIDVVTAPPQVDDDVVQTGATTSSITIKWPKVTGATQYKVFRKDVSTSGTSWVGTTPTTELSKTLKSLKIDRKYDIKVKAQRKSKSGYVTKSTTERYLKATYAKTRSGKVAGLKVDYVYPNSGKMSFKWSKKNSVDGYQLQFYNLRTKKSFKKNVSSQYSSAYELSSRTFYKVRIRSYIIVNGDVKKYSAWSNYKYYHLQQLITGEQVSGKAKVKLNWKSVTGAAKYKIYVATSPDGTYKLSGTTKNTYYTLTKYGSNSMKRGKTYYLKVVAVKTVNGTTYKSSTNGGQSIYLY